MRTTDRKTLVKRDSRAELSSSSLENSSCLLEQRLHFGRVAEAQRRGWARLELQCQDRCAAREGVEGGDDMGGLQSTEENQQENKVVNET